MLSAVVLASNACLPTATLLSPVVLSPKATSPTAVLLEPVVNLLKDSWPIPVLPSPLVRSSNTPCPKPVLFEAESKVPVLPSLLIRILLTKFVLGPVIASVLIVPDTVWFPVRAKVVPSKVKLASAFKPEEPVAVVIRLLVSFEIVKFEDQDRVPDPSVVNWCPAVPSAVGRTYATEAVLLPALKPV